MAVLIHASAHDQSINERRAVICDCVFESKRRQCPTAFTAHIAVGAVVTKLAAVVGTEHACVHKGVGPFAEDLDIDSGDDGHVALTQAQCGTCHVERRERG